MVEKCYNIDSGRGVKKSQKTDYLQALKWQQLNAENNEISIKKTRIVDTEETL